MTEDQPQTAPEPQVEEAQDVPVEGAGRWPVALLSGRSLYIMPWTGVSTVDSKSFSAREWAKRKLAKKRADQSRRRNRR